jgi:hypothetical protein
MGGKVVGKTPYENPFLAAGQSVVYEVRKGRWSKTLTLRVSDGGTASECVKLSSGKGKLLLTSDPPGVEVFWRGQLLGKTTATAPLRTMSIDQGVWTLVTRHPVLGSKEFSVTVKPDEDSSVLLPYQYGSVIVKTIPPGVAIKMFDGERELDSTRIEMVNAGPVVYRIQAEDYEDYVLKGKVVAGQANEFVAPLKRAFYVPGKPTTSIVGMKLVWVKGVPETETSGGCWVGRYEVTQEEYEKVMGKNPSSFKGEPPNKRLPVTLVSFDDAKEFCRKLTEMESSKGMRYELPTERQWDYLVADAQLEDSVTSKERVEKNESNRLHPEEVGSTGRPNRFGLFDIRGNVREWCETGQITNKVFRGGAYNDQFERGAISNLLDVKTPFPRSADVGIESGGFRCLALPTTKP